MLGGLQIVADWPRVAQAFVFNSLPKASTSRAKKKKPSDSVLGVDFSSVLRCAGGSDFWFLTFSTGGFKPPSDIS